MNEEYDVIVLGTGLKECILSGLLSVKGKKVLHLDRNGYYGAETASLNLTNLWNMFRSGTNPPEQYGHNRDWNVDLIPKFIMANGLLVKMLLHTKVTRYLEWKTIDCSYVMQHTGKGFFTSGGNKIHKVPTNENEAIKSNLMGLFQKKKCRNFYMYLDRVNIEDPNTWDGHDLNNMKMKDLLEVNKGLRQIKQPLDALNRMQSEGVYLQLMEVESTLDYLLFFFKIMGE